MLPEARKNGVKTPRILIVDDDPGQRSLLDSFLTSQGFETVLATSGEQALEELRAREFGMVISDVRMPGLTGLETLRRARQEHPVLPVLLVTAYADIREAVGAMRDGALNYLAKPIDLDELLATVRQATGLSITAPLTFSADKQLPPHVVARSPLMQAVFHDASLIALSESRILITGESGVGKEVLADVIHAWSSAFIAEFSRGKARFSSSVAECLARYSWPGNVRELRNAMERAALLSLGELVLPEHLPTKLRAATETAAPVAATDAEHLGEIERQAIVQALRKHNFNRTETAKALGISRRALIYKLQRFRQEGYEVDPS